MKDSNTIKLVSPSAKYKQSFLNAIKEFQLEGRDLDLDIAELENNFPAYITKLKNEEKGIGLKVGYVPMTTKWLIDGNNFLGEICVRHSLTEKLLQNGGHIGYKIRPSKRKMGYGTRMLALALPFAHRLGTPTILVTCDDDNMGSAKIIEKNGGVLENKIEIEGKTRRRYWIK